MRCLRWYGLLGCGVFPADCYMFFRMLAGQGWKRTRQVSCRWSIWHELTPSCTPRPKEIQMPNALVVGYLWRSLVGLAGVVDRQHAFFDDVCIVFITYNTYVQTQKSYIIWYIYAHIHLLLHIIYTLRNVVVVLVELVPLLAMLLALLLPVVMLVLVVSIAECQSYVTCYS